jgi:hypothetical protein
MALITSANYKTRAQIAVTTLDSVIALLIPEAESLVATYLDRDIEDGGSDITEYYDGSGTAVLMLRSWPITSVTSVSYLSSVTAGVAAYTAYGTGDYYFDATTGRLFRYAGEDFAFPESDQVSSGWPIGEKNIKVVYRAGWTSSTVPGDMASCLYDLVSVLLHARNGTRAEPVEQEVQEIMDARIAKYRRQLL